MRPRKAGSAVTLYDARILDQVERLFPTVLSSVSEAIVLFGDDGCIVSCNPAAERILERTEHELQGQSDFALGWRTIRDDGSSFPPNEHPARRTLDTGDPLRDIRIGLDKSAERPTWLNVSSEPISLDGHTRAVVVSFSDVTETVRTTRELRRRNRELMLLNRIMSHCAALGDLDSLLAAVATELCNGLGFERVEALKPNGSESGATPLADVSTAGRPVRLEIEVESRHVASLELYPGADNIVGPSRLRTVRMVVEQIEAALQRLTLARQNQEQHKMEALGRLAGGIAHDFNNLLTAIQGHAALGQVGLELADPARYHFVGIQETGRRAAHLTSKLLTFVRGKASSNEPLHVNEALDDMSDLLRRLLPENVTLNLLLDPDLGWTRADPTDFEQIVINLVINAVDAMDDGGRIDVQTELVDRDGAEWIALRVIDDGAGIEAELLERIFEPLFTTKAQDRGTGLGLATVHSIIQAEGGRVSVDSKVGIGTTFEVLLPATESPGSHSTEVFVGELPRGDGRTVLLVEDDPYLRPLMLRAFKDAGYAVLAAARDGEAALRAIAEMEQLEMDLDLVVADVVLPRRDGRAVVDELRQRFPGVAAILMSGYPGDIARRVKNLPPRTAFLEKPFEPADLLRLAARVLRQPD